MTGPGSPAYDNAWFEVNYVRAYTTGGPAPTSTTAASGSGSTATVVVTTTSTDGSGASQTGTNRNDTSGARSVRGGAVVGGLAVVVSVLAGMVLAAS